MKAVKYIFASFLAFVLVLTAVLALVLHNVEARLFSADNYKSILAEQDFYKKAPDFLAEQFNPGGTTEKAADASGSGAMIAGFASMIPPEEIKTFLEDSLDRVFAFVDGKAATVTLSTAFIKSNIDKNGLAAAHKMLESKPECTKKQMRNLSATDVPSCRPPKAEQAKMDAEISKALEKMKSDIPDQYVMVSEKDGAEQRPMLDNLNMGRQVMAWSLLIPLIVIGFIALLFRKSLPSMMRWIGVPLILAGLIGVAISKVAGSLASDAVKEQITGMKLSASTQTMLNSLGDAAAQSLVSPIFMHAIILAVIGVGLAAGAHFVAKQAAAAPPEAV